MTDSPIDLDIREFNGSAKNMNSSNTYTQELFIVVNFWVEIWLVDFMAYQPL